jgi:hypothetical protein
MGLLQTTTRTDEEWVQIIPSIQTRDLLRSVTTDIVRE